MALYHSQRYLFSALGCILSLLSTVRRPLHIILQKSASVATPFDIFNPPDFVIDEILHSLEEIVRENPSLEWASIVYLDDTRVLKRFRCSMLEARAMHHVRQLTTIPVPRVHWAFVRDGRRYIVMDRVKGQTLRAAKISDPSTLHNITQSIISYQRQLEALGASCQSLGSWPEGPYRNSYFMPALQETMVGIEEPGVFQSVVDFHKYWRARLGPGAVLLPPEDSLSGPAVDAVLMHADMNDHNIMVDNGVITAILDWETFGWYPRFWDSLLLRSGAIWSRPWSEVILSVWGEMVEPERSYSAALGRFWSLG